MPGCAGRPLAGLLLLPARDELPPLRVAVQVLVEEVVAARAWLERRAPQRHPRLLQRLATLAVVAGAAGAHQVVPGVRPAAVARDEMVERQLLGLRPTVLASEVVAEKDLAAGQPHARPRPLDQRYQPDDRRPGQRPRRRADQPRPVLEDFGFAAIDQDNCAPWVTDVERLVILIQHQNRVHSSLPAQRAARSA